MFNLLQFWEQFDRVVEIKGLPLNFQKEIYFPKKRNKEKCLGISSVEGGYHVQLSYFVGIDWIDEHQALYIEPKLNEEGRQTDYLQMLLSALKHPEIVKETDELFVIKFDEAYININQTQDLLTPLMVIQFLRIVQEIVRKGLKKSYYKVERNLNGRVKGKVLVGQTISQNIFKNKPLNTFCSFEEFGVNGLENRLLKKALKFVRGYLSKLKIPESKKYIIEIFNYIQPAFESVSEEVSLTDIMHSKINIFYKEYSEGIRLAKMILKRFGYNVTNTQQTIVKTPPFWIDMSKLYELYVLGLLKDRFGTNELIYHLCSNGQELDYLINNSEYKIVADSKYKKIYQYHYDKDDIRQVSGYARMKSVYRALNKPNNEIIDCLIIYPDQDRGYSNFKESELTKTPIEEFVNFYKIPVKLPTLT